MKLHNKFFLITSLLWVCFLSILSIILYPILTPLYFSVLIGLAILFYAILYLTLQRLIFNRLNHLKKMIGQQKFYNHFAINETDEISILTIKINHLINTLYGYKEKLLHCSLEKNEKAITLNNNQKNYLGKLAQYDSLTTLPNHIFFNEVLNKTLNYATRHNKILSVLLISLSLENTDEAQQNKMINKILKEITIRTSAVLRSGDILARSSYNEFFLLLNDIKHAKFAGLIAEKILKAYAMPVVINENEFNITSNIGICIFPEDGLSLEDLQEKATFALYKAKIIGKNTYQYFKNEMTIEAKKHIQLEKELHKAISNNEFILHYQPQFDISTGKISGVEALIRWLHPTIGIIYPNKFLNYTEDNGLIIPIGEWILFEACRTNKSWQEQGYPPIVVSVNLSPKQFYQKNILDVIQRVLTETGLDACYLGLEITEMTIMHNISETIEKLNQFKQLGVKLYIDDFGIGYTSINYLKYFPIDILKIDQSFIKAIPDNYNDNAITNAIIALGHNLDIKVIAEGVETDEQLQFLTENACDAIQGYYLSRPLAEKELILQFKYLL